MRSWQTLEPGGVVMGDGDREQSGTGDFQKYQY